jgi:hypothetical protein
MSYFKDSKYSHAGQASNRTFGDDPSSTVPTMKVNIEQKDPIFNEVEGWCTPCGGKYPILWNPPALDSGKQCCTADPTTGEPTACHIQPTNAKPSERTTYLCSKIDPTICDRVIPSKIPIHADFIAPADVKEVGDASRLVTCSYDLNNVAKSADATAYYTQQQRDQWKNPKWFDEDVMIAMCSERSDPSICPAASEKFQDNQDHQAVCGNWVSSPLCREWATEGVLGKKNGEDVKKTWCFVHKGDPTCEESPTPPGPTPPGPTPPGPTPPGPTPPGPTPNYESEGWWGSLDQTSRFVVLGGGIAFLTLAVIMMNRKK